MEAPELNQKLNQIMATLSQVSQKQLDLENSAITIGTGNQSLNTPFSPHPQPLNMGQATTISTGCPSYNTGTGRPIPFPTGLPPQPLQLAPGNDLQELRDAITALSFQVQEIANAVINQGIALDNIEQYQRRNCLIFYGLQDIPKDENGKFKDHKEFEKYIVAKINSFDLGIKINKNDIDAAHPLKTRSSNTPVIVKFTRRNIKHTIYGNKKNLKNLDVKGIGITEALTKRRLTLVRAAKQKFGKRSVSTIEGNVFIYTSEGRRIYIYSLDDLDKYPPSQ